MVGTELSGANGAIIEQTFGIRKCGRERAKARAAVYGVVREADEDAGRCYRALRCLNNSGRPWR